MNKRNYQKELEKLIDQAQKDNKIPSLFLHSCCAPCSSYVLEYLSKYFDITVFYYNPNILPKEEFIKRENALKDVISHFEGVRLIVPDQYESEYISYVKGHKNDLEGGARCELCFTLRLEKTAEYLKAHSDDFDYFATTLTVSPHKNAPLINRIGNEIANNLGVEYLDSDFKKRDGYLRSTVLCREWGIYRQVYCGCISDLLF